MSSTPGNLKALLAGKATRRTRTGRLRPTTRSCSASARTSFNNGGGRKLASVKCSKVVSAKLETLKNLIPNGKGSGTANNTGTKCTSADDLFKETADYIVLLRTQVVLLQKLVEFYGSSSTEEENKPNAAVLS